LGLVLGLAALTKLGGLALWPLAVGVLLAVGLRHRTLRRTLLDLALVFAVAVAVAGWWYLRNWQLYGDPTGLNRFLEIVGRRDHLLSWRELWGEFEGLRISYWALFGWFNVPLPTWVYRVLDGFSLVALVGLPLAFLRRPRTLGPAHLRPLLLPVAWIGLILASLVRWTLLTPGTQGRLLFPAIWAISLLLIVGWDGWRPDPKGFCPALAGRGQGKPFGSGGPAVWLAIPIVPLALLAILCPFRVIRPAYAKPPLLTADQIPQTAQRADVTHAGVLRLLAYELPQDAIRPGERLPVTLYWQAVAQTDQNLSVFVHLLGPDGEAVGQLNSFPGLGAYPTSLLSKIPVRGRPGAIIKDTYPVPVAITATAPALLQVDVGLYQIGVGGEVGLLATDGTGQPASGIIGAVRLLPHRPPTYEIAHPVRFDLDGQAILLGHDLSKIPVRGQKPGFYRPGDTVELTLYWQAQARMTEDYHVFVHLIGPDGQTAAQGDKAPLDGAWPTWAWEPGYPVRDSYPIRLPQTLAPGNYELRVGLYRLRDGQRVPVRGPTGRVRDAAIILDQLEVR
jgi:hypothetical protein